MIRRINEIMLSLLTHASLPPTFWVEALHTATYLHNILPTPLLANRTPTSALYLKHPTYDHLRTFGCACFPNLTATQPHKLAPRSTPCIFLGYPTQYRGYRCLDMSTSKVILSRHVTFDETNFPYASPKPNPPHNYSFLETEPSPLLFHPQSTLQFETPTPSPTTAPQPPPHPWLLLGPLPHPLPIKPPAILPNLHRPRQHTTRSLTPGETKNPLRPRLHLHLHLHHLPLIP